MSLSQFRRSVIQNNGKLPRPADGKLRDLPDVGGTTMWFEHNLKCPNFSHHKITGSTSKVYCYDCGVWWNR